MLAGESMAARVTLTDRADAYARAFPEFPASHLRVVHEGVGAERHEVLYGRWVMGNDYRNKTRFYGAFPPGFLERLMCLFPDVVAQVLHVFSGSLPPGPYERCDLLQEAEIPASVYDLPHIVLNFQPKLVIADPPYSEPDAEKYGTPMVDRRRAIAALAKIVEPGCHLAWLDQVWPMHRKAEWTTVARIAITRSTNHRLRDLTIFERRAA